MYEEYDHGYDQEVNDMEISSPYLNTVVAPARVGTVTVSAAKPPAGRKKSYEGIDYILNK